VRIAPLTRLGIPHSGITRTGDTADGYRVMSIGRLAHAHTPLSLLELALVVVVVAIAGAVAVPEFLDLRQDASDDAAKTRLTQATRSLERHHASAGTYAGAVIPGGVRLRTAGRGSFCVEATAGGNVWHAAKNARLAPGACPR
jgi:Tfp pilus assembly protein FimT